jgi:predicted permease
MGGLAQDLRFALRGLRRSPGFTAIAVVTLALAVGAGSAIFSVVSGVLLRPLPYGQPERIVTVLHTEKGFPVAPANFLDWRDQSHVFDGMGAAQAWSGTLRSAPGAPTAVRGLQVTAGLFAVLGVPAAQGRGFVTDDEHPGAARAVVLTHRLWSARFGGDPSLVGRTVEIDGAGHTVVGIMPAGFEFAPFWWRDADLFIPLDLSPRLADRSGQSLRIFGRLKGGQTVASAQREMDGIWRRLAARYPEDNRGIDVRVHTLHEKVVGKVRAPLLVLLGGVMFVLLIACANLANLLLARAATRRKEIAVRASLGAGRARIIRQLLTESLVLAVLGGGVGVLLARWAVDLLVALGPKSLPRLETITLDGRVLAFSVAVALGTGLLFGLAPALRLSRVAPGEDLTRAGRGVTEGAGGNRLRGGLVVSQVALALVLLAGAGLMGRTFQALLAVDAGFDARGLLSAIVRLDSDSDRSRSLGQDAADPARAERARAVYREVVRRLEALPGVQAVSATNHLPVKGDIWSRSFVLPGERQPIPRSARYRWAAPGYFRTMGIPLVAGRELTSADGPQAPGVAVVNQAFAAQVWPGQDPLGKLISVEDGGPDPRRVVGVVKDVRQRDWTADPGPEMYLAYLQGPAPRYLTVVVRGAEGAVGSTLAGAVRQQLWEIDRRQPPPTVLAMQDAVDEALGEPRFNLLLLNLFAVLALSLAAVGIYGVMAYVVSRRTQEIGIRLALGARPTDVRRLVVGQGMALVLVGVVLGLGAALVSTRAMQAMLFGVTATDPLTFAAMSAVLVAVALLACYLPARRAMRVDPMVALRAE